MTVTLELTFKGASDGQGDVTSWFETIAEPAWRRLGELIAGDCYVPAGGQPDDPYVDDGPGPDLLVMIDTAARTVLEDSARSEAFRQPFHALPSGIAVTATPFDRRFYPVAGEAEPSPLEAPFSYVVRYHGPAESRAGFIEHYTATHATALGLLPGIRNVICYIPLAGVSNGGLNAMDYLIGNEVVFDSLQDFNRAMASPVRNELREHWRGFPQTFSLNTHYPMQRRRFLG